MQIKKYTKGFSNIEVVLASSIFILLLVALSGVFLYGQESTVLAGNRNRALMLAEEGMSAVKNIRDDGFINLVDGNYDVVIENNEWVLSEVINTDGFYDREVNISPIEEDKKEVEVKVSWSQNKQRDGLVVLNTVLTNWIKGVSGSVDLGNQPADKVQTQGDYAYLISERGDPNFVILDISDYLRPEILGSVNLNNRPVNLFVLGDYAYVTDNVGNVSIVNISDPNAPYLLSEFIGSKNADASGVYTRNNNIFYTRLNRGKIDNFLVLDNSNINNVIESGNLSFGEDAYELVVDNDYAYVAVDDRNNELQVVDIQNPSSSTLTSSVNLPGNGGVFSVSLFSDYVLIGQDNYLRIVDVSNPQSPSLVSSFDAGGDIKDISLNFYNNNVFVVTDNMNAQFQMINLDNINSPVLSNSLLIPDNAVLNGVAYNETHNVIIAVSKEKGEQILIIKP